MKKEKNQNLLSGIDYAKLLKQNQSICPTVNESKIQEAVPTIYPSRGIKSFFQKIVALFKKNKK